MENTVVKVIYDDDYEFAGWIRQINNDYYNRIWMRLVGHEGHSPLSDSITYDPDLYILPADEEPVNMMYTGHYAFGCTLPNEVVKDKASLRMEISIGGNDLIYHIRK